MARLSEKTSNNPYYLARKAAAERDDRFASRSGASEITGISEDSLYKYESYITTPPLETVVCMADRYHEPGLMRHYCAKECPIGKALNIPQIKCLSVELAALRLCNASEGIGDYIHRIKTAIDDGKITDDEVPMVREAVDGLQEVAKRIQEVADAYQSHLVTRRGQ